MRRWALAVGGVATAGSLSVWLATGWWPHRLPVAQPIVVDRAFEDHADTLRRGEPLSALFARRGLRPSEAYALLAAAPDLNPRRTRAGRVFEFRYPLGESVPVRVATRLDANRLLRVSRGVSGWHGALERVLWRVEVERVDGAIQTSLSDALHDAIPDSVLPRAEVNRFISDLADNVFGWEIDFSRDVTGGDRFHLAFERLGSSLDDVRYGRLIAARIETRGAASTAYLLPDSLGRNAYYDERGISLRRTFKKAPVAYLHISSRFSNRRFHPVLGIYRAHEGTDFAAHMGTEIYATGDGVVRFAGRNGGYGLMVAIRHPRQIETRYAHMSRIAIDIQRGARVGQGQVIGYVGASGLANGPHVHYEFLKDGRHLNPRAVDLGDGTPLPEPRRKEFADLKARYDRLLQPAGLGRVVVGQQ